MSSSFVLSQRMQYAFFDFDETLVRENTFRLLCRSLCSRTKIMNAICSGVLSYNKDNNDFKQCIRMAFYKTSFKGIQKQTFIEAADEIGKNLQWNEPIVQALLDLKAQGAEIVVITASPRIFVERIIHESGLPVDKVVGTELIFEDSFTGNLLGEECVKREKVNRLVSMFASDRIEQKSVSFGNLPDDGPMLERSAVGISVEKDSGLSLEFGTRKEFGGCKF